MKILYSRAAHIYFNELSDILYKKNYFSYKESSREYARSLVFEMESTIHIKQRHKAPRHFERYGGKNLWYVAYPKNKRTTWYFFFTYHPDNNIYYIQFITNNHIAGHLLE